MRAIRKRLTYANVMSSIAVFLVLGGATAFAASQLGKNSVGSKQLKKNAVTAEKIKADAVTGDKVKNGSLTGADIDVATLGTVPNATKATNAGRADTAGSATRADTAGDANTLQGNAASAFVRGSGDLVSARRELALAQTNVPVLTLPGIGSLTAECKAGPEAKVFVNNTSGAIMDSVTQSGSDLAPNGVATASGASLSYNENLSQVWRVQSATRTATPTIMTLTVSLKFNSPGACVVIAQATVGS